MNFREQAEKRMSYAMPVSKGQRLVSLQHERNMRGVIQRGEEVTALADSAVSCEGMVVAVRLSNGRTMLRRTSTFAVV